MHSWVSIECLLKYLSFSNGYKKREFIHSQIKNIFIWISNSVKMRKILTAINSIEARLVHRFNEIEIFSVLDKFADMVISNCLIIPMRPMRQLLQIFNRIFPILQIAMIRKNFKIQNRRIELLHFAKISNKLPNGYRFHILNYFLILVRLITCEKK